MLRMNDLKAEFCTGLPVSLQGLIMSISQELSQISRFFSKIRKARDSKPHYTKFENFPLDGSVALKCAGLGEP